jgi:hypothetical protein
MHIAAAAFVIAFVFANLVCKEVSGLTIFEALFKKKISSNGGKSVQEGKCYQLVECKKSGK